jgi:predicted RNase H-like HicB family nuclease
MPDYVALIHKDTDSDFGISFPDFPGCISAGTTLSKAVDMGKEALSGHMALIQDLGHPLPEPSSFESIMADADHQNAIAVLISVPVGKSRTIRVNITLTNDLLQQIDDKAEREGFTRSGFLARAARHVLDKTA